MRGRRRALLLAPLLAVALTGCADTSGPTTSSGASGATPGSTPGGEQTDADRLPGSTLLPDRAALSPEGDRLVVPCPDDLCVWSTGDGSLTDRYAGGATVAWSSQDVLATGTTTNGRADVVLLQGATGEELRTLAGPEVSDESDAAQGVTALAFSPDATMLAAAYDDGTVRLWSVTDGAPGPVLDLDGGTPDELAFDPAGARLAVAVPDGPATIWDALAGEQVAALNAAPQGSLAWSPDGAVLATDSRAADDDATITLWDATTFAATSTYPEPVQADALAFSPDSAGVAFSTKTDPEVRLWSVRVAATTKLLPGHDTAPRAVLVSPDGARVYSVSATDGVLAHDVATGDVVRFEQPAG